MYEIHECWYDALYPAIKHCGGECKTLSKSYHCQALHMSIAYVANYKHNISYSMESRNELSLALCCTNWYADESQLGPKFCTLLCTWSCLLFYILAA